MSRIINITDTLTAIPVSLNTGSSSYASVTNPNNGLTDASSTTYAQFNLTTGSQATTTVIYQFDCSSIPNGATINSVTCQAKCSISNTTSNNVATRRAQLYSGNTAKGTAYTVANSTTAFSITAGTWTRAELENVRIRLYGVRGTRNTTSNYYFRFYGATLSVSYTFQGVAYEITAVSNTDLATVEPASQEVFAGESCSVTIRTSDTSSLEVLDNDVNVISSLIEITKSLSNTGSYVPVAASASGLVYDSDDVGQASTAYQNCIGQGSDTANNPTQNVYRPSAQSSNTFIFYSFDFSEIPSNAVVQSVACSVKGHIESTSQTNRSASVQLISGSTLKGSKANFTSTSNQVLTVTPGTWTRDELDSLKLRFEIGVYGGLLAGATVTVNYDLPDTGDEKEYQLILSNITADHTVVVQEPVIIPPDEDPEINYYNLTISSINATTDPRKGTIRVEEGTTQVIQIDPSETKITLVTDNGVDITNQLVSHQGEEPSYTVTARGTYGFTLNSNNYYESQNKGVSNSVALSRINLDLPVRCLVTLTYINYAEATYDFGVISKLDTALTTTAPSASGTSGDANNIDNGLYERKFNSSADNTATPGTVSFEVPEGEHFIDIKFGKDQGTNSNNDSLQVKVTIETLEPTTGYTYTLQNIAGDHSLIFIFGDVTYYFVTSAGTGVKLYPAGQTVQLPGDNYNLTIVPDNPADTVTVRDNNVDVSAQLERKEVIIEKDGQQVTVVNYFYLLPNVQTTHNITVLTASSALLFIKVGGEWIATSRVYKKADQRWQPVDDLTTLIENNQIYVRNS